ncbi:putative polysaccharide biosynthesis protein [Clostridium cellulovorans]|uniref:Polysaccharide biosynthesis protein n=1 Tax=Clostridium cellulovorans (strain ATCC 35296 / DSM 3052 / OCM 3 / 743B) TaxID=573061 RepID=D9SKP7_CLOC7|nr:polysaccharide biosynthesis protein [Clostridium cellulovorans]ADL53469.1 polysaccharide biosynthesis protein [Clostridium cellulovorans 743B]
MKKQSMLKGTLILGISGIIAKILGFFFRWPLIMLIGDEGMGYYQMAFPLLTVFFAAASGIPIAVSKLVSERSALGDKGGVLNIINKAMMLMVIIGGGFSAFILLFSQNLVSALRWDPKAYYSIVAIAFAPVIVGLVGAFRGFFQGHQNMTPTAISEVIEQIARVVIGVGLAYILLPKGIEFSAAGAAFGAAGGGVFGLIYLLYKFNREKVRMGFDKVTRDNRVLTKIIKVAAPISIGSCIASLTSLLDSILIPQLLFKAGFDYKTSTMALGQLGKVSVLVHLPLTLALGLSASLIPIIASEYIKGKKLSVIKKSEQAICFSMVIAFPCCLGLFFMADPILNLLFPGKAEGYMLLKYLSISIPFMVMTQITTAILQGVGKLYSPLINSLIGGIVKIILTLILVPIPQLYVFGGIIGTIVGYIITSLLNLKVLIRDMKIKFSFNNALAKPAYSSVFMIIPVILIHSKFLALYGSEAIATLSSITIGVIIYCILIIVFRVFDYNDLMDRVKVKRRN